MTSDGFTEEFLERFAPVDWKALMSGPPPAEDWILWPLVERGQSVSLYSRAKAGKSLVTLDLLSQAIAGTPALGRRRAEPIRVLYLDAENSPGDLRARLHALAVDADWMGNLVYLSFPPTGALDTPEGASNLEALVDLHQPDLVVLDTVSRFIAGPENDSDTWLRLYRLSLLPLKRRGVAVLRLDHAGKDEERGERGSSAKNGDVDASWALAYDERRQTRTLTRKLTRTGHGPERIVLDVQTGPLAHRMAEGPVLGADPVSQLVRKLDELDVPIEWGRDRAGTALRDNAHPFTNANLSEALKARREAARNLSDGALSELPLADRSPDRSESVRRPRTGGDVTAGEDLSEPSRTGDGQVPAAPAVRPPSPSKEGGQRTGRTGQVCTVCSEPSIYPIHPHCEEGQS